ncbi:DNA repair protein RecO [Pleurocapsales cyanobacterium LEGE 06147]|nr:DNA repair protein RecO [Pleurocapsales cyanobacterium LEGE 06147]
MSQTYQATGIILKGQPLAETDRLVTVLTSEHGLIRAVAPGARKHKSRLRGRSELFVVNNLLIVKGRSLDKIIQADTVYTYPGLSRDLGKLAAAQYLAELVLCLALSEQPQIELYELINEHLRRLEKLASQQVVYPHLAHAVFHLLAIAGVAPQVHACCLTHKILPPNFTTPNWQVGFSFEQGGIINLAASISAESEKIGSEQTPVVSTKIVDSTNSPLGIDYKLNAVELTLMQQLSYHSLLQIEELFPQGLANLALDSAWIRIERILREYSQFYLGKSIRSATLVDNLYLVEF